MTFSLIVASEYASNSARQQEAVLEKLGVAHSQTPSVEDISTGILKYLVHNVKKWRNNPKGWDQAGGRDDVEDIESLKLDLVKVLYETTADENQLKPPCFQQSETNREKAQSLFLARLQYDSMIDRESRIAIAHESTFRWVFQENQSRDHQSRTATWSSFPEWLESSDQLYWITGKAGSGKSTLMKFLCSPTGEISPLNGSQEHLENSRCYPYLKKWAGTSRLIVASFYFWNSGMEVQMTQLGLLRTLLYQVVVQCPSIIPVIAPKHWESLCFFGYCLDNWSVQDLYNMLSQAIKALNYDSKICIFVDGLDEFNDRHEDLIGMVKSFIQGNKHIKICTASRPWNVFQTALGHRASLRLEDLTFDDIKLFVQAKFHADTEFEILRRRYPAFAD